MKPATEIHEGPEALQRFEDTMKALFSHPKADVLAPKKKSSKTEAKQKSGKRR